MCRCLLILIGITSFCDFSKAISGLAAGAWTQLKFNSKSTFLKHLGAHPHFTQPPAHPPAPAWPTPPAARRPAPDPCSARPYPRLPPFPAQYVPARLPPRPSLPEPLPPWAAELPSPLHFSGSAVHEDDRHGRSDSKTKPQGWPSVGGVVAPNLSGLPDRAGRNR